MSKFVTKYITNLNSRGTLMVAKQRHEAFENLLPEFKEV